MTILSVEDNEINQVMLTQRLMMRGYNVVTASTGQEALDVFSNENDVQVILLDIGLPDIDGITVAQCLRNDHGVTLPIIFLSGHTTTEFKELAGSLDGCEFMPKPVDFEHLFDRLTEILQSN